MAVKKVLRPPEGRRFKERLHAYGGAGVGKSSITLSCARYMPYADFHVIDLDYSFSYERLLETEYEDVYDQGNVHIHECEATWDVFAGKWDELVKTADPDVDWITLDPVTLTWDMVQAWWSDTVMGTNIADYLAKLRKDTDNTKEYSAALSEGMTWPAINKQYMEKFYKRFHAWRGNSILISEAQEVGKRDDEDLKSTYGFVGFRPKGQKTIPHVAATNLFLDHPSNKVWRMTTVKDRGRDPIERVPFDEFAPDYLEEVAGWEMSMEKV